MYNTYNLFYVNEEQQIAEYARKAFSAFVDRINDPKQSEYLLAVLGSYMKELMKADMEHRAPDQKDFNIDALYSGDIVMYDVEPEIQNHYILFDSSYEEFGGMWTFYFHPYGDGYALLIKALNEMSRGESEKGNQDIMSWFEKYVKLSWYDIHTEIDRTVWDKNAQTI